MRSSILLVIAVFTIACGADADPDVEPLTAQQLWEDETASAGFIDCGTTKASMGALTAGSNIPCGDESPTPEVGPCIQTALANCEAAKASMIWEDEGDYLGTDYFAVVPISEGCDFRYTDWELIATSCDSTDTEFYWCFPACRDPIPPNPNEGDF